MFIIQKRINIFLNLLILKIYSLHKKQKYIYILQKHQKKYIKYIFFKKILENILSIHFFHHKKNLLTIYSDISFLIYLLMYIQ